MFDLVADVGRYSEFLPWVVATRIRSNSETEMVADMLVGFKALREKFTSRVLKDRPRRIERAFPLKTMNDVIPPSLPLPAPHAMRKGRAVRVRLFTPRQRAWLVIAFCVLAGAAVWVMVR